MRAPPSLEERVLDALRGSETPLSAEQILERLPAELLRESGNFRQKVRTILARPEVGHAARGQYVYLPRQVSGSTLRVPLTGREAEEGTLWPGSDPNHALRFRQVDWRHIPEGTTATCELPDGSRSEITVAQWVRNRRARFGWLPLIEAGETLREWLRAQGTTPGDALRAVVPDGDRTLCTLTLERLAERDRGRAAERNRELADTAAQVLKFEIRGKPLSPHDLSGWLLARGFYHDDCPPDPLDVALAGDPRFTQDEEGRFALASRWEWTRFREPDMPQDVLEAFVFNLVGGSDLREREAATNEADRRALAGIDLLAELEPWLKAVGFRLAGPDEPLSAEEVAADEAEKAARRGLVYRIRVALAVRPSGARSTPGETIASAISMMPCAAPLDTTCPTT